MAYGNTKNIFYMMKMIFEGTPLENLPVCVCFA